MPSSTNDPNTTYNLTSLVPNATTSAVHLPSADAIVSLLAARYKQEYTSTYIGDSTLVVVNPLRILADASDASKAEYEERAYNLRQGGGGEAVQPHAYDLACRVYLMMRRTGESQGVLFRWVDVLSILFGCSYEDIE